MFFGKPESSNIEFLSLGSTSSHTATLIVDILVNRSWLSHGLGIELAQITAPKTGEICEGTRITICTISSVPVL